MDDEVAVAEEEKIKVSPFPWELHTTPKSGIKGEAYIRAADPEDELLGEIVADVMNLNDAKFIIVAANDASSGTTEKLSGSAAELLREAYFQLHACFNQEAEDEVTEKTMTKIRRYLKKKGYFV